MTTSRSPLPARAAPILLALLVLLLSGTATLQAASPVLLDTDMAIDDWFALLYLDKHPQVDLRAITFATSGESRCQPSLTNAAHLLQLNGSSPLPAACGDAEPLDGYFVFPEPWRTDADTLSGIDLQRWLPGLPSHLRPATASGAHAVELIHTTLHHSSEPVTIVAVGPLTNIAQWLQRYPQDIPKLRQLVIMGGSYAAPGNIIVPGFTDSHPNTVAEWNFFVDPLAAHMVLAAPIPKVLVGLDVTNHVRITHAFADHFKSRVYSPAAEFADQVFDKNRWFIESGEYYFWDVMAAMIAVDPTLCQARALELGVRAAPAGAAPYLHSSDLRMTATTRSGGQRQHLDAASAGQVIASAGAPPTAVCLHTRPQQVFDQFVDTLTAGN